MDKKFWARVERAKAKGEKLAAALRKAYVAHQKAPTASNWLALTRARADYADHVSQVVA